MKRFKVGDLAITHGLRAAMNNGRIVRIVAVVGPDADGNLAFAYQCAMVDGSFHMLRSKVGPPKLGLGGAPRADHKNLRPLADKFEGAKTSRRAKEPVPA
jgi:hypothetical protein